MTKTLAHLHPVGIVEADIDFMGHVNNARYLNWVQDAVLAHWPRPARGRIEISMGRLEARDHIPQTGVSR